MKMAPIVKLFSSSWVTPGHERLAKAEKEKKLEDKVRGLSKFQLLIIDEIGAHCFFQLISRRYEMKRPLLSSLRTNLMANGEIFSRITLSRRLFWIEFSITAQRSI
jgi:DNA replication protein DnaC